MIKNPFLRAVGASAYIVAIVLLMQYGLQGVEDQGDGLLAPMVFLSLLVLSVATMGYFFVLYPLHLLIEHKPLEAAKQLLTTIAVFACITGGYILIIFSLIR